MKNILLITLFSLSQFGFSQNDTITLKSSISDVTVFFNGAEVTRSGNIILPKGKHILLLDELPNSINEQSIQVEGFQKASILSVKSQLAYYNSSHKSKDIIQMEEKIKSLLIDIKKINNQIEVYDIEETFLLENSKLAGKEKTVSLTDLKLAAEFYQTKLLAIKNKIIDLQLNIEDKKDEIRDQYRLINQAVSKRKQAYLQIFITIEIQESNSEKFDVSYYVPTAGWTPSYDFRVKDIDSPLKIVYNSNVYQSTGEDWNKVNITLSSNNPSLSGVKPELKKWIIGRTNSYANETYTGQSNIPMAGNSGSIKGTVIEVENFEPVPFANVTLLQNGNIVLATTTDFDGKYTLKPVLRGFYDIKVSYIGYNSQLIQNVIVRADKITDQNIKMQYGDISDLTVKEYTIPLFEKDQTTVGNTTTRDEIESMSVRSVADIARTSGNGTFSRDDGLTDYKYVRGNRSGSSVTFIDGVKVMGADDLPKSSIHEVNVYSGGKSAQYGDGNNSGYSNYTPPPSAYQARLKPRINEISSMVKVAENTLSLEYTIQIPYTIPSDGKEYNLKIKETQVSTDYEYYIVPKIDKDAFLVANITEWEKLNLLSGQSSLYYKGTFIGESYIDVNQAEDTFSISLGRDKSVFVSRELSKTLADKQFSGSTVKETVAWDIVVKNTKNNTIKVNVEDQYPISEYKSVEVDLLDAADAIKEEKTGKLSWSFTLEPEAKKEFGFKYLIKYPKFNNFDVR